MKFRFSILVGLTVLAVCVPDMLSASAHTASASGLTVVLPASAGKTAIGVPADKFWTPTPADIRHLEADLKTQEAALTGYDRQYMGIIQNGRRMIYVNGFSSDLVSDFGGPRGYWRHRIVFVNDGGNAFFNTTYDPKLRRFNTIQYNGLG